jgi:hypothetical protein
MTESRRERYLKALEITLRLVERAAQWGADQRGEVNEAKLQEVRDQELEACRDWLCHEHGYGEELARKLRTARRPKPPSLKEEAMQEFDCLMSELVGTERYKDRISTVRRALEAIPDD